jgi:hypothetical protein
MLGAFGQVIRAVAGLKKAQEGSSGGAAGFSATFEWPVFLVSLVIGFTAGALASLVASYPAKLDATFLLTFIAAGYAGADFIEAFIRKQPLPTGADPARERLAASPATGARTLAREAARGPMSVESAVIQVVADVKHVDPDNVALSDKLSDLQFSVIDRRNLANEINIYFQQTLGMVFDTLMHPSETENDQTVSDVIQKVKNHNPRPRTQPLTPTS